MLRSVLGYLWRPVTRRVLTPVVGAVFTFLGFEAEGRGHGKKLGAA